jgi:hypothetical protein
VAFKHGRLAEITVNTKALSTFCDSADINIKVATANTSTFTSTWETFIAGLAGATVQLAGDYDPTVTTGPASVLAALIGAAPFPCIFYPAGNNAAQGTSHTFNAILTDYKEGSKTTAAVTFAATLLVTGVDTIAQL